MNITPLQPNSNITLFTNYTKTQNNNKVNKNNISAMSSYECSKANQAILNTLSFRGNQTSEGAKTTDIIETSQKRFEELLDLEARINQVKTDMKALFLDCDELFWTVAKAKRIEKNGFEYTWEDLNTNHESCKITRKALSQNKQSSQSNGKIIEKEEVFYNHSGAGTIFIITYADGTKDIAKIDRTNAEYYNSRNTTPISFWINQDKDGTCEIQVNCEDGIGQRKGFHSIQGYKNPKFNSQGDPIDGKEFHITRGKNEKMGECLISDGLINADNSEIFVFFNKELRTHCSANGIITNF